MVFKILIVLKTLINGLIGIARTPDDMLHSTPLNSTLESAYFSRPLGAIPFRLNGRAECLGPDSWINSDETLFYFPAAVRNCIQLFIAERMKIFILLKD